MRIHDKWTQQKLMRLKKHRRCKNCEHYRSRIGNEIEHCDRDVDANGNGGQRFIPLFRRCQHFELYELHDRYGFESYTAYAERLGNDERYQRILQAGIYREFERL
jgi:hypothetical protein